ncbi:MAG: glucosamine-6-phosphate deaminase [Thermoanaerobaculia bacterium]
MSRVRRGGPHVEVLPGAGSVSRRAAAELAALLRRRGGKTLLLASGRTMAPIYRDLARLHRTGAAPFAKAETFNLDELRVAPDDPRSFRSFMERHLFSRVDLARERIHFLNGNAPDPERECARYEREISARAVDLALVGIGVNGHVAYLEPGASLAPRTGRVRLSKTTRARLAADGMRPVPREALTVGLETLLASCRILLVATGREKAAAVAEALRGPISARCPASFLSLHPALTLLLDRAAARRLD